MVFSLKIQWLIDHIHHVVQCKFKDNKNATEICSNYGLKNKSETDFESLFLGILDSEMNSNQDRHLVSIKKL